MLDTFGHCPQCMMYIFPRHMIKFCVSFILKPLSITIVNPELRGFSLRSGICVRLKFMLQKVFDLGIKLPACCMFATAAKIRKKQVGNNVKC